MGIFVYVCAFLSGFVLAVSIGAIRVAMRRPTFDVGQPRELGVLGGTIRVTPQWMNEPQRLFLPMPPIQPPRLVEPVPSPWPELPELPGLQPPEPWPTPGVRREIIVAAVTQEETVMPAAPKPISRGEWLLSDEG